MDSFVYVSVRTLRNFRKSVFQSTCKLMFLESEVKKALVTKTKTFSIRLKSFDLMQVRALRFMGTSKCNSEAVVRRCSVNKHVLKNFAKFAGKHLCQSLFFNKSTCHRHARSVSFLIKLLGTGMQVY